MHGRIFVGKSFLPLRIKNLHWEREFEFQQGCVILHSLNYTLEILSCYCQRVNDLKMLTFSKDLVNMRTKSFLKIFGWFGLFTLVWVDDVYAYLDPGTGSMLFQSVIAAIAGGVFLVKTYWSKLKYFFVKKDTKLGHSSGHHKK